MREPGLRLTQVAAAEEQASILAAALPVGGCEEEARVPLDPFDIGVEHREQLAESPVERLRVAEVDPLRPAHLGRDVVGVDVSEEQRPQALALRERALELARDVGRSDRVGAEHQDDAVRRVDLAVQVGLPVVRPLRDVAEVDVARLTGFVQPVVQASDELDVLSRVRDEEVALRAARRT